MRATSSGDRGRQLQELEMTCRVLAELLTEHGEVRSAEAYRARAEQAARLRTDGFTREDLNALGGQFPRGPWWLNPRAVDGRPMKPWQDEVARLAGRASAAALDLRAIGTHGPR